MPWLRLWVYPRQYEMRQGRMQWLLVGRGRLVLQAHQRKKKVNRRGRRMDEGTETQKDDTGGDIVAGVAVGNIGHMADAGMRSAVGKGKAVAAADHGGTEVEAMRDASVVKETGAGSRAGGIVQDRGDIVDGVEARVTGDRRPTPR